LCYNVMMLSPKDLSNLSRPRKDELPVRVTCILASNCLHGTVRGRQCKINRALTEFRDGFLPCGHWACPRKYAGQDKTCCELHSELGCTVPGFYVLEQLDAANASGKSGGSKKADEESNTADGQAGTSRGDSDNIEAHAAEIILPDDEDDITIDTDEEDYTSDLDGFIVGDLGEEGPASSQVALEYVWG
jgi:hypothetical protein